MTVTPVNITLPDLKKMSKSFSSFLSGNLTVLTWLASPSPGKKEPTSQTIPWSALPCHFVFDDWTMLLSLVLFALLILALLKAKNV